jgi:UDP-2,3-diacylglucosamine hydrolase
MKKWLCFFRCAPGREGRSGNTRIDLLPEGLKRKVSALYINGDLFDFWLGDNQLCLVEYRPLLETLRELRDEGVEVVYIEGNHDFYLGKYFTDVLGASVFSRECIRNIDGKRIYMETHFYF